MAEMSVNDFVRQFESVFGKSPAIYATDGEKTYIRGTGQELHDEDKRLRPMQINYELVEWNAKRNKK